MIFLIFGNLAFTCKRWTRQNEIEFGGTSASPQFQSKFYETNGSPGVGKKTGLGIALKVMAGDQVNILRQSNYNRPVGGSNTNGGIPVTELLNAFVGSGAVAGAKGVVDATSVYSVPANSDPLTSLLNPSAPATSANASINYILFDEQMRFIDKGVSMVAQGTEGSTGLYKQHTLSVTAPKSGYLYVYCSNESNYPVFFDKLWLVGRRSVGEEKTEGQPAKLDFPMRAWINIFPGTNKYHLCWISDTYPIKVKSPMKGLYNYS